MKGKQEKTKRLRLGSLLRFSFENFFPERDNVRPFPNGSARADFEGSGKTPAFASSPPNAAADRNNGKNLRQAQQRVFCDVNGHDSSPCEIVSAKRITGFFLAMLSMEKDTAEKIPYSPIRHCVLCKKLLDMFLKIMGFNRS